MDKDDKYWEELISDVYHEETSSSDHTDYRWAATLKGHLRKVFLWDSFNPERAKYRLDKRLRTQNRFRIPVRFLRRAAVILVAMVTGALVHTLWTSLSSETLYSEISVPLGQMTQIRLPDGSQVWLNSGSVFKYPTEFARDSREVFVDGEAFMEVTPDQKKPFIVNTSTFAVEVKGTSFNVTAYRDDQYSNVTLVEGSVSLRTEKGLASLAPGQSATIGRDGMPVIVKVETAFYTSWKEGKIVFRKETLEEIAKKMERWYNIEIDFSDEQLKKLEFSGTFLKYKPVEQVFKTLSLMDNRIDFVSENRADQKNIIHIIKMEAK